MAIRTNGPGAMRRRSRGGVVSGALVGFGLVIAALIVSQRLRPVNQTAAVAPVVGEFDAVKLPVPAELVPAGTKVKDIKFRAVAFPKHQVPPGALTELSSITEAVTITALPANLPLFSANFSLTAHINNPVLERIPPGMRAITVKVDATAAVEGWAGSGSWVDVLLVEKDRTVVIAEKVKILSAERSVSPVEGSSAPTVPSTVTLLVTQEQCLAINTAIPLGKIAFALRNTRDEENWNDTVYTKDKLRGGLVQTDSKGMITGYVAVKESGSERAFALTDGKWIKSETIPEGFLADHKR